MLVACRNGDSSNIASEGGGAVGLVSSQTPFQQHGLEGQLRFYDVEFTNNSAAHVGGGAVYSTNRGTVFFYGCNFRANNAYVGGDLLLYQMTEVMVIT